MAVAADLRLDVRTASGRRGSGRIIGTGQQLTLHTSDPDVLVAAAEPVMVGRLADVLAEAGITLQVVGPGERTVAELGVERRSPLGAAVTRSKHVVLAPRAAGRLLMARRAVRAGLVTGAVGAAFAAVYAVWRTRCTTT